MLAAADQRNSQSEHACESAPGATPGKSRTVTMTDTEKAIVPAPSTAPSVQLTALERYGRSGGNLYGELLKFSGKTGAWTSGAQSVEVPIGTQLVAIVSELVAGFVKWKDGELLE